MVYPLYLLCYSLIMEKKVAEKRIIELRKTLEKHRVLYHVKDAPIISDEVYDSLMQELAKLEEKYPEFEDKLSPTKRIGGEVLDHFEKVKHEIKQWSFDNVFNLEELKNWEERNEKVLLKEGIKDKPSYVAEMKIDGLKVVLTYKDGVFIRGATRGDGSIGEDITENLKTVKTIPLNLKDKVSMTVIGEAWMKKTELDKINKKREKEGLPLYANTRNLTAGTLRQLDTKVVASRNIQIYAYDIEGYFIETQNEELNFLEENGFLVNKDRKLCKTLEEIQASINDIHTKLSFAQNSGRTGMVTQMLMVLEGYQTAYKEKMDELYKKQNIQPNINVQRQSP